MAPTAVVSPATADARFLAPSPVETRRTLAQAGIVADLGKAVPRRFFKMDEAHPDLVAIRTGVVVADTVLTLEESNDADLLERLGLIQTGLATMGAGEGLLSSVRGAIERTRNGAGTRAELLREVDALVGLAVPTEGVGPDDRTGPLLQAGAWLEMTDLVAATILATGRLDTAPVLLRQKDAAGWFLTWVRSSAQGRAPQDQLKQIEGHLASLRELAVAPNLDEQTVRAIHEHTSAMIALL